MNALDAATLPPKRWRQACRPLRLALLPALFALSLATAGAAPAKYEPNWDSLRDIPVPAWFDDAKFGILIHWGVYSVAGFSSGYNYTEHFPQFMYRTGAGSRHPAEHAAFLQQRFGAAPPDFGYKDLVPLFRAERFDPAAWARLFHRAGARYVILTGEHHDGFALWDSALTPWNAVRQGPRQDLVGLLAAAVREAGLKYGVSFHRERHYWFFAQERSVGGTPHAAIAEEIRRHPEAASLYGPFQFSADFMEDYLKRWQEITDRYHPDFMWIDGFASKSQAQWKTWQVYGARLIADYLNQAAARNQEVYFNNKGRNETNWPRSEGLGCRESDNLTFEGIGAKWQNPATLGRSYGYSFEEEKNDDYKTPTELIHLLCDVVSKNGNLLLNIGPRADGTIPEAMERRLLAIGRWLAINGEAIYGTRPWKIFGETIADAAATKAPARKRTERPLNGIRFTAGQDAIYALMLEWPVDGKVTLKSLATGSALFPETPTAVTLLGRAQPLQWSRTDAGLLVELPIEQPGESAYVLKITTQSAR
jgi:alpha-L-fucosidase